MTTHGIGTTLSSKHHNSKLEIRSGTIITFQVPKREKQVNLVVCLADMPCVRYTWIGNIHVG